MIALLLISLCTGGIDEDLRQDVRWGWRGPVQDVAARSLGVGLNWHPLLVTNTIAWAAGRPELHGTAEQALVSLAAGSGALLGVRALVRRPRPEYEVGHWWDTGFPSGHLTTFFSVATVYAWHYPGLRLPVGAAGLLLAFSRVYLGEHYPSDVLAGAALGAGAGILAASFWPERGVPCFRSSRWAVFPELGGGACGGLGAAFALRF